MQAKGLYPLTAVTVSVIRIWLKCIFQRRVPIDEETSREKEICCHHGYFVPMVNHSSLQNVLLLASWVVSGTTASTNSSSTSCFPYQSGLLFFPHSSQKPNQCTPLFPPATMSFLKTSVSGRSFQKYRLFLQFFNPLLPKYHHPMTKDCGFPPILETWTPHSDKENAHCICLVCVSMMRVCVFSYSIAPHCRLLSTPRTVSIFLILQLKTISEWVCTRGKELNGTASLGSVIACFLTAWCFYLSLL